MFYIFDAENFLVGTTEDGNTPRCTSIAPEVVETATMKANFVGHTWVLVDVDNLNAQKQALAAAAAEKARVEGIVAQIESLESTVTQRRLREAVLTPEGAAWLADVDLQITALRNSIS